MCGIAGLLINHSSSEGEQLEVLVGRMQTALQHRGPDDKGIYISDSRQAALAHTRLAILDLSPAGHQPMSSGDRRYWITFNGEIYNFPELRQSLQSQGEQFHSQTDTEVILKLYQKIGHDCVDVLRGMFAFAIWDELEKTCFLARDPLGIKPLYYWQSGSTLVFASEVRSILASKLPTISLSNEGLYGYLVSGSVPEPHTMIAGVKCLPAGYWFKWQAGNSHQQQYWKINFGAEKISPAAAKDKVRAALIDSIKHHFVSDVPVGVFLSGGIDSSTIVALARQTQTEQLRTYSIAFAESEWNEGEIAQKVAQKFDTEHTEYKINAASARDLLPQFLAAIDQPTIDGFNTFCISQIAQEHGTKVVLSGLGGDELFGGYKSFQQVPLLVRLSQSLQPIQPMGVGVGRALEYWGKSTRIKRLGDFLQQTPSAANAYRSFRGIFSHQEACLIAADFLPHHSLPTQFDMPQLSHQPSIADEVSLLEISYYMRNQLLRDSDVMSMAWGLELRVPLVDRVLLEAIASIPSQLRVAAGKQLLIQSVPELPSWVVNHPKKGFSFPFEQWLETEWNDIFPIEKLPTGGKNIFLKPWYRRWSLGILQHWWNEVQK